MSDELPFEPEVDTSDSESAFLVDVDGFEGPLDLLLELARRQKVDLQKILILLTSLAACGWSSPPIIW